MGLVCLVDHTFDNLINNRENVNKMRGTFDAWPGECKLDKQEASG